MALAASRTAQHSTAQHSTAQPRPPPAALDQRRLKSGEWGHPAPTAAPRPRWPHRPAGYRRCPRGRVRDDVHRERMILRAMPGAAVGEPRSTDSSAHSTSSSAKESAHGSVSPSTAVTGQMTSLANRRRTNASSGSASARPGRRSRQPSAAPGRSRRPASPVRASAVCGAESGTASRSPHKGSPRWPRRRSPQSPPVGPWTKDEDLSPPTGEH